MKKIAKYIAVLLLASTVSCTKNFTTINPNPSTYNSAEPQFVLPGVFLQTVNRLELSNIQSFWEYGHIIEAPGRYNPGEDNVWSRMYVNALGNTIQLKKLFKDNPAYKNVMAINDIWECYIYYFLVTTYGPIPYTHMGDTSLPYVPYDSENDVYTSILARLKADAAILNPAGDKFPQDPIYQGDMTKWTKFANTLRLRVALTVQKNLPDLAASNITELMANENTLIGSDADAPKFNYGTASGSQSQYFVSLTQGTSYNQSSGSIPTMSDYSFLYFRTYKDPRLDAYFVKAAKPQSIVDTLTSTADAKHYIVSYPIPHAGQPKSGALLPGWSLTTPTNTAITGFPLTGDSKTGVYSQLPQNVFNKADRAFYIITYAEVCFMKAEAKFRNYGGSLSADQYYYAGINANFSFFGLTPAQATAYEAQDGIKWSTASKGFYYSISPLISSGLSATDNLKKIWIQQWLNYYPDGGFDAWVLQRRTQNLTLPPHTSPGFGASFFIAQNLPDRFPYPTTEAPNNTQGYVGGTKLLSNGLDQQQTRLAFEPNYTAIDWTKVSVYYDISYVQKYYGFQTKEETQAAFIAQGVGTAADLKIINSY